MRKPRVDPKTAADAAEARSKTKDKATPKKKAGPAVEAARKNPDVDVEARALFLQHLPKIAELKTKLNTANANLRNAYKTAKSDGFLQADFDVAFKLQGDGGEKAKKAAIARELTIAKWLGCDLGSQLDMFVEDARVPAADRAYEEGQTDSMSAKTAKTDYAPETEQYRRYMAGYHDATEARLKKGIKKLDPAVEADTKETAATKTKIAKQKGDDEKVFDKNATPPTSGTPVTRSEFKEMQAKADGAGDIGAVPASMKH